MKSWAEAKAQIESPLATTSSLDNPLVEPESAPQLGAEPANATAANTTSSTVPEPSPAAPEAPSVAAETPLAAPEKPAKAAAAG